MSSIAHHLDNEPPTELETLYVPQTIIPGSLLYSDTFGEQRDKKYVKVSNCGYCWMCTFIHS